MSSDVPRGGAPGRDVDLRASLRPWARPLAEGTGVPRDLVGILHAASLEEARRAGSGADWRPFLERLENSPANLTWAQFRGWLRQAPTSPSARFNELISILHEENLDFVGASFNTLAQRHLAQGPSSPWVAQLLNFAERQGGSRHRAAELIGLLQGGGGFFAQAEFQSPHLLRELTSPLALGSFGLAGLAARGASLGIWMRATRPAWHTFLAAEGAALAAEVPTLVLSRRLGQSLVYGAEGMLDPAGIMSEMNRMWLPFAFLRGSGNLLRAASPALRTLPALAGRNGSLSTGGAVLLGSGGFASEVLSLAAGHSANLYLGLESPGHPGSSIWTQSLLTAAHQRIAGHLIERSGIFRLPAQLEAIRQLRWENRPRSDLDSNLEGGRPEWFNLFGQGGLQAATAGRGLSGRLPSARPLPPELGLIAMSQGPGNGNGGRKTPSNPPRPTTRSALALELLRKNLEEYQAAAHGEDTLLTRLAGGLRSLVERISERPDLENDETFAQRISELELELDRLRENKSAMGQTVETIRILLRRPDVQEADPQIVQEQHDALEKDEAQRSAMANSFGRLHGILKNIRDFGLTPERRQNLQGTIDRLSEMFSSTFAKLPGAEKIRNYRNQQQQQADRRLGAIFGMAFRPELADHDSPVAREKRGSAALSAVPDDLELEYLHRAILAFAHTKPKDKGFPPLLQRLGQEYQASPHSAAALQLFGETLHNLAHRNHAPEEIPDLLSHHPLSGELRDQLLVVDSLRDGAGEVGEGLDIVAQEPSAADYFASGLLAMLRSNGEGELLQQWIQFARSQGVIGFHPSIAISLFGAAHGRQKIPSELLLDEAGLEAWLKRVEED